MSQHDDPDDDADKLRDYLRITPKGIATWIIGGSVYRVDHNFNPPRITKIGEDSE